MAERAQRDPLLDEWRESLAAQLRAILAIDKIPQADLARAMGMKDTALSRRLLGKVSFTAEELLFLSDWMNRNVNEIMAAAKVRTTNPCLSQSEKRAAEQWQWATAGYELSRNLYGVAVVAGAA